MRGRRALSSTAKRCLKIWVRIAKRAEARLGWLRGNSVQVRAILQLGFAVFVGSRSTIRCPVVLATLLLCGCCACATAAESGLEI
jgi:hypothetical protein